MSFSVKVPPLPNEKDQRNVIEPHDEYPDLCVAPIAKNNKDPPPKRFASIDEHPDVLKQPTLRNQHDERKTQVEYPDQQKQPLDPNKQDPMVRLKVDQSTQANWHLHQTETIDCPKHHKCPHFKDLLKPIGSPLRSLNAQREVPDTAKHITTRNKLDKKVVSEIEHIPQIEKPDSAKMSKEKNPIPSRRPPSSTFKDEYVVLIHSLIVTFRDSKNKISDSSKALIQCLDNRD